ncbi:hypothetical protein PG993_008693 [Apiospora rasikravindrae]|uniref:Ig-like domain-containing protein n=1 Tax=Apiospora rasikravindrae TaxID=990691 RepID=A0ABR1SQT7_9PEZI
MRFVTVAALVSGAAASALPGTKLNPLHRRTTGLFTISPSTCASYITVTETPAVVTLTASEYVTVTAETVTSTDVTSTETTQESTDIETATVFETSFVTAFETAATVTETVGPALSTNAVEKRKKKRGDSCKRRSSSLASASENSFSSPSTTPSPSGPICTSTVTAAALHATTTVIITGSATATAVETVTSIIVATVTTTISTTDLMTTAVPTTVAVTATSVVTSVAPPPTPTFVLKAVGGSVNGRYITLDGPVDPYSFSALAFTTNAALATSFVLRDDGNLVPASVAKDADTTYSSWLCTPGGEHASNVYITTSEIASSSYFTDRTSCRLAGLSALDVGSTGTFVCPNDGTSVSQPADSENYLIFETTSDTTYEHIALQYTVVA